MAGDFQNDATNAGAKAISEIVKGFFTISKFLIERKDKRIDNKYKQSLTRTANDRKGKADIDGFEKGGQISKEKLLSMKGDTIASAMKMTEKQFKEFSRLADRCGLLYSADVVKGKDKNTYAVWYKRDKLPLVAQIKNQMVINLATREMNKEIKELKKEKRENEKEISRLNTELEKEKLTGNDEKIYDLKLRIEELENRNTDIDNQVDALYEQLESVYEQQIESINKSNNVAAYEDIIQAEELVEIAEDESVADKIARFNKFAESGRKGDVKTFNSTLNHITSNDYSRDPDKPLFVADRTNPTSYIEIHCDREIDFKGEEYTKSTYSVFKDGEKVLNPNKEDGNWDDARFKGRPKNYFQKVKVEMKTAGDFKEDLIVFGSKEQLEKYQSVYKDMLQSQFKEKVEELNGFKNYGQTINDIKKNLEEKGYEIREDINRETGEVKYGLYRNDEKVEVPQVEIKEETNLDTSKTYVKTLPIGEDKFNIVSDLKDCELISVYEKLVELQNEKAKLDVAYQNNENYISSQAEYVQSIAGEVTTDDVKRSDTPYQSIIDAKAMQSNLAGKIKNIEEKMQTLNSQIESIHMNKNTISGIKAHEETIYERKYNDILNTIEEKEEEITHGEQGDISLEEMNNIVEAKQSSMPVNDVDISEHIHIGHEER